MKALRKQSENVLNELCWSLVVDWKLSNATLYQHSDRSIIQILTRAVSMSERNHSRLHLKYMVAIQAA